MKKPFLLIVISLFFLGVHAQDEAAINKLLEEGIALHDKGDYKGAISKYDKILKMDEDNLHALAEKAMSLWALGKPEKAVELCEQAIQKHPGDGALMNVYVTYGNALDAMKKPDEAVKVYDRGITEFPKAYQLHFNKGITLSGLREYDRAEESFQTAIQCKPDHASSHNALARTLHTRKKKVPAILAYCRFLMIEPESPRAKENYALLQQLLGGNVEKTSGEKITINLSMSGFGDTTDDGRNKENNFSATEMILSLSSALSLDDKNKKKNTAEKMHDVLAIMISSLSENASKNHGFYWEYYVPYFVEMKDAGQLENFGYVATVNSDDSKVTKWIKANPESIKKLYLWNAEFDWPSL